MKKRIMSMTRTVAVLIIAMFTGSIAMAQPGGQQGGQQGPPSAPSDKQITKMVKSLDKELDLSEEQSEQVSEIYFAHFDKVEALMKKSSRPERSEMEALDADLEKNVKAVLDKDQKKDYTAWLKEQEKNRPSQGSQGGQRPPR